MSKTIDERVVEMRFDNAQFERNVSTSMSTLDKLKQCLNLTGVTNGIEQVGQKFSAFETIATGALLRIGSQAVDTAEKLVKSLSTDQIAAGWSKYEQKTSSVQTLVNSTGKTVKEIDGYLERLMWFSDETSYSFTDMTSALAQMTSSGGDIDKLMPMIMGIANATAFAGKGAREFQSTIRNLAQSYQAGNLQLMDMKSLNLMGTSSKQLKETFISVAESLGKIKKGTVTLENFDETLKDKWADTQVMEIALGKFSALSEAAYKAVDAGKFNTAAEAIEALAGDFDDLAVRAFKSAQEAKTFGEAIDATKDAVSSGWLNTFDIIFGNYEESKVLWTDLANELWDIFASSAEIRNDILKEWKELGGRDDLVEAFWNIFHAITGIVSAIKSAFGDVFNPLFSDAENGAKRLQSLTARLKELTGCIKIVDDETGELTETGEKIKSTFKGIFAVLGIVKDVVVALIKPINNLFSGTGHGILDLSSNIGEILVKFRETIRQSGILAKTTEKMAGAFKAANHFLSDMAELFRGVSYIEGGGGLGGVFESVFDAVNNVVELFFNVLSALTGKNFSRVSSTIATILETVRDKVVDFCDCLPEKFEKFQNGIVKAYEAIKQVFDNFGKIDTGGLTTLSNITGESFKPITTFLEGFAKILGAVWKLIKKITPLFSAAFTAIGHVLGQIGDGFSKIIENIDFGKLIEMLKGGIEVGIGSQIFLFIKNLKDGVKGAGKVFGNVQNTLDSIKKCISGLSDCISAYEKNINAKTLLTIASAIGILVVSMLVLSSIDPFKIRTSAATLTVLFGELVGSMALLSKIGDVKKIKKIGTTMIALSAAILILAIALRSISNIDENQLNNGLLCVSVLLTELVIASKALSGNKSSKMMKGATNALIFSAAITVLANAVKKLSSLSLKELAKGLGGLTVLIAELVIAAKLLSGEKIASGIKLADGTVLSGKSNPDRMMKGATNALIFSAAITVLANAVKKLSSLSLKELAKGLGGLTVLIGEMVISAKVLGNEGDSSAMMKGAINAMAFAGAILVLSETVTKLSGLSWEDLAKGLVGVSVLMAEMVISAKLMNGSGSGAASMIAAAGAMLVLSISLKALASLSWEQIAVGLVAIAGAFTILGIAGYLLGPIAPAILSLSGALALMGVGAALFGAGLLLISTALVAFAGSTDIIVGEIITIISRLITALPDILHDLAESLNASISSIVELLVTVAKSILMALYDVVPMAVEVLLDVILSTLQALATNIQPIIESLVDIVVGIINGLASGMPKIIASTVELFKSIFNALANALGGFNLETILEAIAAVALLEVLMAGIAALTVTATVAVAPLPLIGMALSDFIAAAKPFLDEIQNVNPQSLQGAKALAEMILILTANGILDGLTSWFTGGHSMVEFGKQLSSFAPHLKKYYSEIKGIDSGIVESSANAAKALAKMADNLPNSGGIISWIAGDNSLADFAEELKKFAPGLSEYAALIDNVDPDKVSSTGIAAAKLAETLSTIQNIDLEDLTAFGEELISFGPRMMQYARSVKGLDADVIANSANAAKALCEMSQNLPGKGGLTDWLKGEQSLTSFAEELKTFGPALVDYSKSVSGLERNVVETSANAAKSLFEMAANLPSKGGLSNWFTGDQNLTAFGVELKSFGPHLKAYYESIKSIEPNIVDASANSAKALAELSDNLPRQGGLLSIFGSTQDLGSFGENLVSFGKSFAQYSNDIKDCKPDIINGVTDVIASLIELQNGLSNSNALFFSKFGLDLVSIGKSLSNYYSNISNIKIEHLSRVFSEMEYVIKLAKNMSTVDTSKMVSFSLGLKVLGQAGLDNFIKVFTNSKRIIEQVARNAVMTFLTSATELKPNFKTVAESLTSCFLNGINAHLNDISKCYIYAIKDALASVKSEYLAFYLAASYLVSGFCNGISDNIYNAAAKAAAMARASLTAAKRELQERSPSKAFYEVGDYAGRGYVNSLDDAADDAYDAGKNMAHQSIRGTLEAIRCLSASVNDSIDSEPTIRPVLDLSDVTAGANRLNAMLSQSRALSISTSMSEQNGFENQNVQSQNGSNTINFTQNNYSPKALSRIEIYRNTKNLLNARKGW